MDYIHIYTLQTLINIHKYTHTHNPIPYAHAYAHRYTYIHPLANTRAFMNTHIHTYPSLRGPNEPIRLILIINIAECKLSIVKYRERLVYMQY